MTAATTKTITINTNKKGDDKKMKSPKRLKKYRMDAGYTIYSLADRLGVNFSTVSYWENGVKFPRPKTMMELEELFGVGYRDLFTDLSESEIHDIEERMKHKPE